MPGLLGDFERHWKYSHGKRNLSLGLEGPGVGLALCASQREIELKSLILAQIERWRHALHMQVERGWGATPD